MLNVGILFLPIFVKMVITNNTKSIINSSALEDIIMHN